MTIEKRIEENEYKIWLIEVSTDFLSEKDWYRIRALQRENRELKKSLEK